MPRADDGAPTRRRLALALVVMTVAGLAPLLREPVPLARPIDCSNAIMVGSTLWCGAKVPANLAQLCRHVGLVSSPANRPIARPLHPGDAIDPLRACLGRAPPGRMAPAALAALELPVDVNAASLAELSSLPGVGPVTAERIARERPFGAVDELIRVRGIGPKRLAALRARARVRPP